MNPTAVFARCAIILVCVLGLSTPARPWGWTGHRIITDRAIYLLPTRLQAFYESNRPVLIQLSVYTDQRKEWTPGEAPRHYIDLTRFPPDIPKTSAEAKKILGTQKLEASGWLPWNIQDVYADLVRAMRARDYPAVLRISADLAHYVADAHIPLHTTDNFDGQQTGDNGVHARFEYMVLEQFPHIFTFDPMPAGEIVDVPARVWAILLSSNIAVPDVLKADRNNAYENREADGYSIARAVETHGPLLARQANHSAHQVASFWYTAWIEAGRPAMPDVNLCPLAAPPPLLPSGECVYYDSGFIESFDPSWPMETRRSLQRVSDFLRLETAVRIAWVRWSQPMVTDIHKDRRDRIVVKVLQTSGDIDAKKIQRTLDHLLFHTRVRVNMRENETRAGD